MVPVAQALQPEMQTAIAFVTTVTMALVRPVQESLTCSDDLF